MSRTIAYVRVSTDRQDVENQKGEIYKLVHDRQLGKAEFVEETDCPEVWDHGGQPPAVDAVPLYKKGRNHGTALKK